MHGPTGTLAQVWIQTGLLALGTVLFVLVDVLHARRRRAEPSVPWSIPVPST
jgi:hypothetical protein